tara:strand:- start:253 stop:1026 length:774 start_codon:yes stop_codon:yes gene_type:complete
MSGFFKRWSPGGVNLVPDISMFLPSDIIYNTQSGRAYHLANGEVVRFDYRINVLTENESVTIGTGGDYTTLNAFLDKMTSKITEYSQSGITVVATFLAGYVFTEQVLVRSNDFGFITLKSTDPIVTIDSAAMTQEFSAVDYGIVTYPAFGVCQAGSLPKIDCLFQFTTNAFESSKHGCLSIGAGSTADILDGAGFINTPQYGLIAMQGGNINATNTACTGANDYDIAVKMGGVIAANGATGTLSQNHKKITTDGVIW